MKMLLLSLLSTFALSASALAHGGVELGPNRGHLVDFGEHGALSAEFVPKGDTFEVSLYDETAKKAVPITTQTLTVIHKETNQKMAPELKDGKWVIAKPAGKDYWLILQLKEATGAKAKNGRLHYDEATCGACKKAEWLCECAEKGK